MRSLTRGLGVLLLSLGWFAHCGGERTTAAETAAPPETTTVAEKSPESEVMEWRERRAKSLQSDDGWLTLVGLEWLKEGRNVLGSAKGSDVRFPQKAPSRLGTITLAEGVLRFEPSSGSAVTVKGQPVVSALDLETDADGEPTVLEHGSFRFHVIKRSDRFGVRIKDRESEARRNFRGLEYYPIAPTWRVEARFERYSPAKKVPITNIVGQTEEIPSPGALVFTVGGATYRLDPIVEEGSDELFIIFADQTNGAETYGGGRYLYAPMPAGDTVTVDFNKSYNPPCVFSDFATCPLPPPQNKLPVALRAGEKKYEH